MAVPKKRHSKSKVGRRRMHIFLKEPSLIKCENCGKIVYEKKWNENLKEVIEMLLEAGNSIIKPLLTICF